MNTPRRGVWWAVGLALAMVGLAGAWFAAQSRLDAAAPSQPVQPTLPAGLALAPLGPGDEFDVRTKRCRSEIHAASGQKLAMVDGDRILVRLNAPSTVGGRAPFSRLISLSSSLPDRSKNWGNYRLPFEGQSDAGVRGTGDFDKYTVDLRVSNKQHCGSQPGGVCNTYSGTLEFYRQGDPEIGKSKVAAPLLSITLREECAAEATYRYEGLFNFTGMVDHFWAMVLGGGR